MITPLMSLLLAATPPNSGPPGDGWRLVFADEFDGDAAALDANWEFQNGPSGHILCSRWRDNALLDGGLLRLVARRERRGGQDWTAASCWSRRQFRYGFFECRYRYLPATGTNNSFWIMTTGQPAQKFEIDINEGHFPNEVNMNLHNHSGQHWARGGRWYHGRPPAETQQDAGFSFALADPVTTRAVRLVSRDPRSVRVMELRAFAPSERGYPSVFPNDLEAQPEADNRALAAVASASSQLDERYPAAKAIDGQLGMPSRWVSAAEGSPHWLRLDWPEPVAIGCLQLISGWLDGDRWADIVEDFQFEYLAGDQWLPVPGAGRAGLATAAAGPANLGESFHVYALDWNRDELVYYFDGQEIRRTPNDICHGEAPVWLSLAIMHWAGPVTDAIDGRSMDVDWVRVWQR